jgi:hypothetical protein
LFRLRYALPAARRQSLFKDTVYLNKSREAGLMIDGDSVVRLLFVNPRIGGGKMQRLRTSLEQLYGELERAGKSLTAQQEKLQQDLARQAEALKVSRGREANALALSQKVATRLDRAIERTERLLQDQSA